MTSYAAKTVQHIMIHSISLASCSCHRKKHGSVTSSNICSKQRIFVCFTNDKTAALFVTHLCPFSLHGRQYKHAGWRNSYYTVNTLILCLFPRITSRRPFCLRHWRPSQQGRVLHPDTTPTSQQISDVVLKNPTATVLTVTRNASRIVNDAVINALFQDATPLAKIQCDCEMYPINIYQKMRVNVTQNRDKPNGVVNGQIDFIHSTENKTIFIKLPTNKIISVYQVTYTNPEGNKKVCYPFMPCYSMTITKSQGQNLQSAIIWFDTINVPKGGAYVALSREKKCDDLTVLTPIKPEHITPVN